MAWLVAHMWMALGLTAIFGLLFGWAFRGISLKPKARDAMVQRDVALTELEQTRVELDQLYAAQSKGVEAAIHAGDDDLQAELEVREQKIQALGVELDASREELKSLKEKATAGAAVVAAGAVAAVTGAVMGDNEQGASSDNIPTDRLDAGLNSVGAELEWRNRYLESRTRVLEAKLAEEAASTSDTTAIQAELDTARSELEAAKAQLLEQETKLETDATHLNEITTEIADLKEKLKAGEVATASALAAAAAAEQAMGDVQAKTDTETIGITEDTPGAAKAEWHRLYLSRRLAYLEEHPPQERQAPATGAADEIDDAVQENLEDVEVLAEDTPEKAVPGVPLGVDIGAMEQELARLRWRNRYLEGRIAYIDGDKEQTAQANIDTLSSDLVATVEDVDDEVLTDAPENVEDAEDSHLVSADETDEEDDNLGQARAETAVALAAVASAVALAGEEDAPDTDASQRLETVSDADETEPVVDAATQEAANDEEADTPAEYAPELASAAEEDEDIASVATTPVDHDADNLISVTEETIEADAVETIDAAEVEASVTELASETPTDPQEDSRTGIGSASEGHETEATEEIAVAEEDLTDTADEADFTTAAGAFLATLESDGALVKPDMAETPDDGGDDFMRISGIGARTAESLHRIGIWNYEQIVSWTEANKAWVEQHLGEEGRIDRDKWQEQAADLMQSEEVA